MDVGCTSSQWCPNRGRLAWRVVARHWRAVTCPGDVARHSLPYQSVAWGPCHDRAGPACRATQPRTLAQSHHLGDHRRSRCRKWRAGSTISAVGATQPRAGETCAEYPLTYCRIQCTNRYRSGGPDRAILPFIRLANRSTWSTAATDLGRDRSLGPGWAGDWSHDGGRRALLLPSGTLAKGPAETAGGCAVQARELPRRSIGWKG